MSLPWIRVYNDLPDHHKSDQLAGILGEPRAWTHVLELWLWVSRIRPDGSLSGLSPSVVARRAGWTGDADAFVDALRQCGFLDGDQVHDWDEYQGAHSRKLENDRTRIRQARDKKKNVAATVAETVVPTVAGTVGGSVPPLEERRVEEKKVDISTKSLALFADAKAATGEGKSFYPTESKPRRGRPPKDKSPEAEAERLSEKADGDRWMNEARKLTGLGVDELRWTAAMFMAFRRQRKARGIEQLMRALEGLQNDRFAKENAGWLVSDGAITKGLARWKKEAGTIHVSRQYGEIDPELGF